VGRNGYQSLIPLLPRLDLPFAGISVVFLYFRFTTVEGVCLKVEFAVHFSRPIVGDVYFWMFDFKAFEGRPSTPIG
jgi:hypothetical protein